MVYVPQMQLDRLKEVVTPGKVVIIYGPRRVGKTTLLKKFLIKERDYFFVTGEDIFVRKALSCSSIEKLKEWIGEKKLLVIDEAQYIPDIGVNLKLIVDHLPHVKVIATGSSTFDLAKQIGAPLTGRQYVLRMYPLSQMELQSMETSHEIKSHLESRLIYGSYPEVVTTEGEIGRQEYLHELVSSYLLKDLLLFEGMNKAKKITDLLTLLCYQIGKEVSHQELGAQLSMSKGLVAKYLDLLEQVFVVVNIRGFSRNLRKEVTKTSRYYFYDTGIRNALINNFNPLHRRNDQGLLWENYLVAERIKKQHYKRIWSHNFFWRTYDQKELDWVEEREGKLFGFEFKWGGKEVSPPKLWTQTYPEATFMCIHPDNYLPFIC